jgi:hypothetical protein
MEAKRKGFLFTALSAGLAQFVPFVQFVRPIASALVRFIFNFFGVKLENRFENTSRFQKMFKTLKCSNLKLFKFENWSHFKNCSDFKNVQNLKRLNFKIFELKKIK